MRPGFQSIGKMHCAAVTCMLPLAGQAQLAPDAGSIQRDQQKPMLDAPVRPMQPFKFEEPVRPAPRFSGARMVLKEVRISGNTVFTQDELRGVLQDILHKEVGIAELDQATARLSRYYHDKGYLVARAYLVRAYLSAKDLRDGIAEIAIIEGRFGKVVTGNRSSVRDAVLQGYTAAFPGTVVREPLLERQLLLLNDLAGVGEARGNLQPGANVGETDLTVDITAAPAVSGSVELDNHGNRFTGESRLGARLNVSSPLGLGDALSLRLTKGFNGLEYARAGYQLPLGSDGFKVGGGYSVSRYRLGKTFTSLDAQGDSDNTSVNISYPFIRSRNLNMQGQLSYDLSHFQDRVNSTATVTEKDTRVANAMLSGDLRDGLGGGGVTVFSLNYGSGRLNITTPAARTTDDGSARTNGQYQKWSVNALRLQSLGERASLYLSFAGQKAGKNLDSSEKFVLGGANGVRAYPPGEAPGDSGYIATAEWRYTLNMAKVPGVVRPFVFADAGAVTVNKNPFAAGENHRQLAAAGAGISWIKAGSFQVQIMLATRLGNQRATSDTDRTTRGWVQVVKSF